MLASLEVVLGDVEDPSCVRRLVDGADVVFHLAALIGIPYSYVAPYQYVATNVAGTLNVLEAVRASGNCRMVHTSTSETYGSARYAPIDEAHPMQGQSPYSATKIGADKLAESYFLSFGTPVATIRPFNTYGPRQSSRAFIPSVMKQLAAGRDVVRVGSTRPKRDLNFVEDTVSGFLAIGASDRALGQVLNVGSGRTISMGELAELIFEVSGVACAPRDGRRARAPRRERGRALARRLPQGEGARRLRAPRLAWRRGSGGRGSTSRKNLSRLPPRRVRDLRKPCGRSR